MAPPMRYLHLKREQAENNFKAAEIKYMLITSWHQPIWLPAPA
jgi:hypothetical protein